MPDICTLVVASFVTTQACWVSNPCQEYGGRYFCTPPQATSCSQPLPHYDCKRDDGTTYQLEWSAGPATATVR